MSFFHDTPAPGAPVKDDYIFHDGSAPDELFAEMQEPKQFFAAPPAPAPAAPAPDDPEKPDEEKPKTEAELKRAARTPAKFVVGALDGGLAYLSSVIAKSDESDSYKASKDEREQLTDLWAEYLKGKGADLPPGVMILVMTAIVYGPKVKMAWDDRKKNELVREQREKLLAQDMEIRLLRSQVEEKTLKEKLNTEKK